jgi:Tol biopolymer transport system component
MSFLWVLALTTAASACGPSLPPFACANQASIAPPPGTQLAAQQIPAVAPDGSRVAFTAVGQDGAPRLWVHSLRDETNRAIAGTDGATFPFWSPDGEHIGFFADGRLKRVAIGSGALQVLTDAPEGLGGSWSPRGTIIFAARPVHAIFSIPAAGGTVAQLTDVDAPGGSSAWPRFLPDGEHFVYSSDKNRSRWLMLGSIRSSERNPLLGGTASSTATVPGLLLFGGERALLGIRFDPKILDIEPPPDLVLQAVARGPHELAAFSTSADGSVIVYGRAGARIIWLDAAGGESPAIPDPGAYDHPMLSPSADEILITVAAPWLGSGAGLYDIYNTARRQWRRVTAGAGRFDRPLWNADGSEIIFTAAEGAATEIRAAAIDGKSASRKLFDGVSGAVAAAVSSRRNLLALVEHPEATRANLRIVSLASAGGSNAGVWQRQTNWSEYDPAFSPDGLRLAFVSMQTGRAELYVTELTAGAVPVQVSKNGGAAFPVWPADGKELFYRDASGIVAVTVEGPASTWRSRLVLSDVDAHARRINTDQFDVSRDGSRLLLLQLPDLEQPAEFIAMTACGRSSSAMTVTH